MPKPRIKFLVVIAIIIAIIFVIKNCVGIECIPKKNPVKNNHNITFFLDLSDHLDETLYPDKQYGKHRYENFIRTATIFGKKYADFLQNSNKPLIKYDEEIAIVTHPKSFDGIDTYLTNSIIKIDKDNMGEYVGANQTKISESLKRNVSGIFDECRNKYNGSEWPGSSLYDFLEEKEFYNSKKKNLLIIFTDGYPYHKFLKPDENKWFLANSPNWKKSLHNKNRQEVIDKLNQNSDLGLQAATNGLDNLRVLIIGTMPQGPNNLLKEKDLIELLWINWFTKMGVGSENIKVLTMEECNTNDIESKFDWLIKNNWPGIDDFNANNKCIEK